MATMKAIPVFRMFDVTKAKEFYLNWLGFKIDWEHRLTNDAPLYMQISLLGLTLHLTEHHGDTTPGSKAVVQFEGDLKEFHTALLTRNYTFNRPGLEEAPWDAFTMEVIDPFGNKLLFNQPK